MQHAVIGAGEQYCRTAGIGTFESDIARIAAYRERRSYQYRCRVENIPQLPWPVLVRVVVGVFIVLIDATGKIDNLVSFGVISSSQQSRSDISISKIPPCPTNQSVNRAACRRF